MLTVSTGMKFHASRTSRSPAIVHCPVVAEVASNSGTFKMWVELERPLLCNSEYIRRVLGKRYIHT